MTRAASDIMVHAYLDTAPDGWDDFVLRLGGTPFHTTSLAAFHARAYSTKPVFLLTRDHNGEPCAAALAALTKSPHPLLSFLLRSLRLHAHPVSRAGDAHAANRFVADVERLATRLRCAQLVIDSFYSGTSIFSPAALGYHETRRVEFTIDLSPSLDDIWRAVKRDQRERIRALYRRGVTLRDAATRQDLDGLKYVREATHAHRAERGQEYQLMAASSFYDSLYDSLLSRGAARLFLAIHHGETIAASFFALFGGKAYSMFSGSTQEGYRASAQSGLLWLAVETLKNEGYHELNRGGIPAAAAEASNPMHGIYTYKSRLGTVPVDCYTGDKVLSPFRNALSVLRGALRPSSR